MRQDKDGSFFIEWVASARVERLSIAEAGEVLEVVRDLRDNAWTMERLQEQRRGAN